MGFDLREIHGKNWECMGRIIGDTQGDILRNTLKSLLDVVSGAWGISERGISNAEWVITNRWRLELQITKAVTDVHDVAVGLHVLVSVP